MPPRRIVLQAANITGQLLLLALAAHHAPRRTAIAGGLMYGSSAVWLRDLWRNG